MRGVVVKNKKLFTEPYCQFDFLNMLRLVAYESKWQYYLLNQRILLALVIQITVLYFNNMPQEQRASGQLN